MPVCGICEKNKENMTKRNCQLEMTKVCLECCEEVQVRSLCAGCKYFKGAITFH